MEEKDNMNIIYHGSYEVVDNPSIIKGKYPKDFGYGFIVLGQKKKPKN